MLSNWRQQQQAAKRKDRSWVLKVQSMAAVFALPPPPLPPVAASFVSGSAAVCTSCASYCLHFYFSHFLCSSHFSHCSSSVPVSVSVCLLWRQVASLPFSDGGSSPLVAVDESTTQSKVKTVKKKKKKHRNRNSSTRKAERHTHFLSFTHSLTFFRCTDWLDLC